MAKASVENLVDFVVGISMLLPFDVWGIPH
jgi:hypothetical protein